MYISCLEEIAYTRGWIDKKEILLLANKHKSEYGDYLKFIAESA
jgi:glucose-1-phosphate thymidylyltransferase